MPARSAATAPTVARLRRTAAVLTLAAVGLTACAAEAPEPLDQVSLDPGPTAPSPEPAEKPTEEPIPEEPTGPVETGTRVEPTPPGTVLGADEPATLEAHTGFDPESEYYGEAQFTSTLLDVTTADPADLDAVDQGEDPIDPATETVYYVRTEHRLEWARTADVGSLMLPRIKGWAADGSGGGQLIVFGLFEPCRPGSLDREDEAGATVTSCDIVVLPAGVPLTYVGLPENPQVARDAHETYDAEPVVWQVAGG